MENIYDQPSEREELKERIKGFFGNIFDEPIGREVASITMLKDSTDNREYHLEIKFEMMTFIRKTNHCAMEQVKGYYDFEQTDNYNGFWKYIGIIYEDTEVKEAISSTITNDLTNALNKHANVVFRNRLSCASDETQEDKIRAQKGY